MLFRSECRQAFLLFSLLQREEKKRLTAFEATQHPFLLKHTDISLNSNCNGNGNGHEKEILQLCHGDASQNSNGNGSGKVDTVHLNGNGNGKEIVKKHHKEAISQNSNGHKRKNTHENGQNGNSDHFNGNGHEKETVCISVEGNGIERGGKEKEMSEVLKGNGRVKESIQRHLWKNGLFMSLRTIGRRRKMGSGSDRRRQ